MKLIKKLRKGFTLIELVVVIAVIAVLAAVSVVSYVAITNKAKQSSDEQAVRQMNTALKASGILGAKDITELFDVLSEEGMDAKNYKPLAKDTFFFWDQENNEIVYAKYKDGQYVGIYPESYKDKGKGDHHWFSLSKEIKTVKVEKQNSGNYTVSSAEQLYTIITEDEHHPTTITLNSDVDLMGADLTFDGVETLNGNDKTLSNLSQLKHQSFDNSQNENRNSGLFGRIDKNTVPSKSLTIQNIKIENSVIGSGSTAACGVLGGAIYDGVAVTVKDVSVENCTVYSLQKGGTLFGYLSSGSVTLESSVSVKDCKVSTLYGEAGQLIGAVGSATFVNKTTNATVSMEPLPTDYTQDITANIGETITVNGTAKNISSGKFVYSKQDSHNGENKGGVNGIECFRVFNKDALFTVTAGSTATYSTGGSNISVQASKGYSAVVASGHPTAVVYGALPVLPSMLG